MDKFLMAGKQTFNVGWNDEELDLQINVLNCVIGYLEGRGDSAIVISKLRMDLELFKKMKYSREWK